MTKMRQFLRVAPLVTITITLACGGSDPLPTPTTPIATTPGAPGNVVGTAGNALIVLAFTPPSADGGAVITGFIATCTAGTITRTATGAASPITVSALTNGTTYSCTVAAINSVGTGSASPITAATPVMPNALGSFRGSIVLGSPSNVSVKANIFAADQSGSVSLSYGTASGAYDRTTPVYTLIAGKPVEVAIDGLTANTRYYYRLNYQTTGAGSGPTSEFSVQTARPAGASFVFDVQGDSHPERPRKEFDSTLYVRTLQTAAADKPDFYIMMGDDFSVDNIAPAAINQALVTERYTLQRSYLGLIGASSPIYLVPGNHEQAAGYLLDGTPNNIAVWAQNARNSHYSQPAPDAFYTGNADAVPHIGLLRNYYAWTWGDALFVVIDPYFPSPIAVSGAFGGADAPARDLWQATHGTAQYQWLKQTLERSTAKYKFVFAHHVMGTQRGGIEVARLWEWGGQSQNGTNEFAAKRPGWSSPIHQLFVANRVTTFFQGHDHTWVRQQLDGVTYQTLPEPADPNYALYYADAYLSGDQFPNSGYTRVTVSPANVKVEYVRTYLTADQGPGKTNGIAFTYTIP